MLLFFSIAITICLAFAITGFIINQLNNKGNSKAEFKDVTENGLEIIDKYEAGGKRIHLKDFTD